MDRELLRQHYRERRRRVPGTVAGNAAEAAARTLLGHALWEDASHIAAYLPNDGELDTWDLVDQARSEEPPRHMYLPRVTGDSIAFAPWNAGDTLAANRFGIHEPTSGTVDVQQLDLVLVPTVAWSLSGVRLGMGGGFYDRCFGGLEPAARPVLLGVAYECQRCDDLVASDWDVPLDGVLTESALRVTSDRIRGSGVKH